MADVPLPSKRPPRRRGRDLQEPGLIELVHSYALSPQLLELCADMSHLGDESSEGGPANTRCGRPPSLPPEVMVVFGFTTALVPGDRKVERFLREHYVWEPIRAHFFSIFPEYSGLQSGSRGPTRSQFQRWYTKIAEDQAQLAMLLESFERIAIDQARNMDLFDPGRASPTRPDPRDTLIGDGTTLRSRFRAVQGDMQVDRDTGEIGQRRFDPDAALQHRKSDDGEVIRSDVAGTQFGALHGTTGEPGENVIVSLFHVPSGPGRSEAASTLAELGRLKSTVLPGVDHVLYDKAMRGKHIDAAFQAGMQIHARVAKIQGGRAKERLVDTGVEAKQNGIEVGAVDVSALRGAACIRVPVGIEMALILLEPGQVRQRPNANGTIRIYREYRIPSDPRVPSHLRGAVVNLRHSSNEADRARGLNRPEVLRLIAEDHDNWPFVAQRSRAESLFEQIKNRWQDKRAPAVGKERQLLRLMFAALGINHRACLTFERRTGTGHRLHDPPTHQNLAA